MAASRLVGTYLVLVGGLYALNGVGVAVLGSIAVPSVAWFGGVYVVVGGLMLVAGGSVIVERSWARWFGATLLALDVLEKATSVYFGDVLEVIWLALSVGAFGVLVFGDPYDSVPRPDLDEEKSVHSLGNLRR